MSTKPRISSWISKTNASLSQIASETGKSKTTVRKYLRGEVVLPDFFTCVALALAAFDKVIFVRFIKYYGFCRGRCHPLLADVKSIAEDYYSDAYNMSASDVIDELTKRLGPHHALNRLKASYFDEAIDSTYDYKKYLLNSIFVPPEVVLLYGFDAEKDPTEIERAINNLCAVGNRFFPYIEKNANDLLNYIRYTKLRGNEKKIARKKYRDYTREMQNAYDTLHTLRKSIYRRR